MPRFSKNTLLGSREPRQPNTVNEAGGAAYKQTPKTALAVQLISSFVSGDHYQSVEDQLKKMAVSCKAVGDWKWIAKACLYTRDVLGLRTSSHFIAACIAANVSGEQWLREFYQKIVIRPDDMMEIISAYWMLTGPKTTLPNALKRGFATRFEGFDEYQLAKYAGGTRDVHLTDVMNLVHPKGELIGKLANGTLAVPHTWESQLSAAGKDPEKRAFVWQKLINERKLGYLAMLRNLRNICKDAPGMLDTALEQLQDIDRMRKARIFPFQLVTAITLFDGFKDLVYPGYGMPASNTEGVSEAQKNKVVDALSNILDMTVNVIPEFEGPSLIAVDSSGSMGSTISSKSSVTCFMTGLLMGAVLAKKNPESEVCLWADRADRYRYGPRNQPVITIMMNLSKHIGALGYGTNMSSVFQQSDVDRYRRVFVMTDMQSWHGDPTAASRWLKDDKSRFLYLWNLQGSGTSTVVDPRLPGAKEYGGFSDRIWEGIKREEEGPGGIVEAIDAYKA